MGPMNDWEQFPKSKNYHITKESTTGTITSVSRGRIHTDKEKTTKKKSHDPGGLFWGHRLLSFDFMVENEGRFDLDFF